MEDHHLGQEGIVYQSRLDAERRFQEQVDFAEVLVEQTLEHQDGDETPVSYKQDQHTWQKPRPELFPPHQTRQQLPMARVNAATEQARRSRPRRICMKVILDARPVMMRMKFFQT